MNDHMRAIANLNTRQWRNAIDGLDEDVAWKRFSPAANSLGFIAFHVVSTRNYFANKSGLEAANPLAGIDATNIEKLEDRPTLARLREVWDELAPPFEDFVAMVDLDRPAEHRFPNGDLTVGGLLQFSLQHEAYHIGQMALLRKLHGLPSMKLG